MTTLAGPVRTYLGIFAWLEGLACSILVRPPTRFDDPTARTGCCSVLLPRGGHATWTAVGGLCDLCARDAHARDAFFCASGHSIQAMARVLMRSRSDPSGTLLCGAGPLCLAPRMAEGTPLGVGHLCTYGCF